MDCRELRCRGNCSDMISVMIMSSSHMSMFGADDSNLTILLTVQ